MNKIKQRIAREIANGKKKMPEIAQKYGVSVRTLYRWRDEPDMRRKIAKHRYVFEIAMTKQIKEDARERIRHWHDVAKHDSK